MNYEKKVSVVEFNAKDWYVSKVDGKIHNAKFIEKQGEQQPEWNEEDERMHNTIVKDLEALCNMSKYKRTKGFYNAEIDWLKAVRKRIGG